ncbi:MAG: nitroreductase family protein [Propionibacteriaceae bacterium]|nr:nitroreductase family protein [Propionibacteriaceae bacterium]
MDFYSVVKSRRMARHFTKDPVDMDSVRRVLAAGLRAPTNDHLRNWEFVVLTDEEAITAILKPIPKRTSRKRVDFLLDSWRTNDERQRLMYHAAIPEQFAMLSTSGCLVLPFYKQRGDLLKPRAQSSLNAFASVWCCIENILLAATAEGLGAALRIPVGRESAHITDTLDLPAGYVMPCYIALGHPAADAVNIPQIEPDIDERLHLNRW